MADQGQASRGEDQVAAGSSPSTTSGATDALATSENRGLLTVENYLPAREAAGGPAVGDSSPASPGDVVEVQLPAEIALHELGLSDDELLGHDPGEAPKPARPVSSGHSDEVGAAAQPTEGTAAHTTSGGSVVGDAAQAPTRRPGGMAQSEGSTTGDRPADGGRREGRASETPAARVDVPAHEQRPAEPGHRADEHHDAELGVPDDGAVGGAPGDAGGRGAEDSDDELGVPDDEVYMQSGEEPKPDRRREEDALPEADRRREEDSRPGAQAKRFDDAAVEKPRDEVGAESHPHPPAARDHADGVLGSVLLESEAVTASEKGVPPGTTEEAAAQREPSSEAGSKSSSKPAAGGPTAASGITITVTSGRGTVKQLDDLGGAGSARSPRSQQAGDEGEGSARKDPAGAGAHTRGKESAEARESKEKELSTTRNVVVRSPREGTQRSPRGREPAHKDRHAAKESTQKGGHDVKEPAPKDRHAAKGSSGKDRHHGKEASDKDRHGKESSRKERHGKEASHKDRHAKESSHKERHVKESSHEHRHAKESSHKERDGKERHHKDRHDRDRKERSRGAATGEDDAASPEASQARDPSRSRSQSDREKKHGDKHSRKDRHRADADGHTAGQVPVSKFLSPRNERSEKPSRSESPVSSRGSSRSVAESVGTPSDSEHASPNRSHSASRREPRRHEEGSDAEKPGGASSSSSRRHRGAESRSGSASRSRRRDDSEEAPREAAATSSREGSRGGAGHEKSGGHDAPASRGGGKHHRSRHVEPSTTSTSHSSKRHHGHDHHSSGGKSTSTASKHPRGRGDHHQHGGSSSSAPRDVKAWASALSDEERRAREIEAHIELLHAQLEVLRHRRTKKRKRDGGDSKSGDDDRHRDDPSADSGDVVAGPEEVAEEIDLDDVEPSETVLLRSASGTSRRDVVLGGFSSTSFRASEALDVLEENKEGPSECVVVPEVAGPLAICDFAASDDAGAAAAGPGNVEAGPGNSAAIAGFLSRVFEDEPEEDTASRVDDVGEAVDSRGDRRRLSESASGPAGTSRRTTARVSSGGAASRGVRSSQSVVGEEVEEVALEHVSDHPRCVRRVARDDDVFARRDDDSGFDIDDAAVAAGFESGGDDDHVGSGTFSPGVRTRRRSEAEMRDSLSERHPDTSPSAFSRRDGQDGGGADGAASGLNGGARGARPKSVVLSDLPTEQRKRFLEFLVAHDVKFARHSKAEDGRPAFVADLCIQQFEPLPRSENASHGGETAQQHLRIYAGSSSPGGRRPVPPQRQRRLRGAASWRSAAWGRRCRRSGFGDRLEGALGLLAARRGVWHPRVGQLDHESALRSAPAVGAVGGGRQWARCRRGGGSP